MDASKSSSSAGILIAHTKPNTFLSNDPHAIVPAPYTVSGRSCAGPGSVASTATSSVAKSDSGSTTHSEVTSLISTVSENGAGLRAVDRQVEQDLADECVPADNLDIAVAADNTPFNFQCHFGFTGQVGELPIIPSTKGAFLRAVQGEIARVGFIQRGLEKYAQAINSGEHHTFSLEFLAHQSAATVKTVSQLDQIRDHLQGVTQELENIEDDDEEVEEELKEAFAHAQPWIMRTRAILVSAHVFYKINYVLASDKKSA